MRGRELIGPVVGQGLPVGVASACSLLTAAVCMSGGFSSAA